MEAPLIDSIHVNFRRVLVCVQLGVYERMLPVCEELILPQLTH